MATRGAIAQSSLGTLLKRLALLALGIGCGYLLLIAYNYYVDPYCIFHPTCTKGDRPFRQNSEPNENFVKIEHLVAHPDEYDVAVFGSSRVGHIDIRNFFGPRAYSMSSPESVPFEQYAVLEYLLAHGVRFKRLFVGVDDISFLADGTAHRKFFTTRLHPGAAGGGLQEYLDFYKLYLLRKPAFQDIANGLIDEQPADNGTTYDILHTGRILCPRCDIGIDKHLEAHKNSKRFDKPWVYDPVYRQENLDAIGKIIALGKAHDIEITFFINPVFINSYLSTSPALWNRFRRELAAMTDYWDFSGLNSITQDRGNYFEASHYRPKVGLMMMARILGATDIAVPGDFGVHVTHDNLEQHIAALDAQYQPYPEVYLAEQALAGQARFKPFDGELRDLPAEFAKLPRGEMTTCSIDNAIAHVEATHYRLPFKLSMDMSLNFRGWALHDLNHPRDRQALFLRLENRRTGQVRYHLLSWSKNRFDVAAAFNDPSYRFDGFQDELLFHDIPMGNYRATLLVATPAGVVRCGSRDVLARD